MDLWHAVAGNTGTDGARGAQADLKLSKAFTTSIWGICLYQPNPLQWPLRVTVWHTHNSQLGGLQKLQIPPGFCGFQWFLKGAQPMLSVCTSLSSPEQLSTVASFLSSQQARRDCREITQWHTHTHTLLQLLSIGTKLHSALAYNLQLIQMLADNT